MVLRLNEATKQSELGYLIQPFWGGVRSISSDYYAVNEDRAELIRPWPPSMVLKADEDAGVVPNLVCDSKHVEFVGLGNVRIEIRGSVLFEWEEQ